MSVGNKFNHLKLSYINILSKGQMRKLEIFVKVTRKI